MSQWEIFDESANLIAPGIDETTHTSLMSHNPDGSGFHVHKSRSDKCNYRTRLLDDLPPYMNDTTNEVFERWEASWEADDANLWVDAGDDFESSSACVTKTRSNIAKATSLLDRDESTCSEEEQDWLDVQIRNGTAVEDLLACKDSAASLLPLSQNGRSGVLAMVTNMAKKG